MVGPYELWSEDFPVGGQKMELFSGVTFSDDSVLEWSKANLGSGPLRRFGRT